MNNITRIKELIELCNKYRDAYYNHQALVPDDVYDRYFDELFKLENEEKCFFADSPTQSVGYKIVNTLPKVVHDIPLLSLDKTKSIEDVVRFAKDKDVLAMIKCDGLTTKLVYKSNGEYADLIEASTRGNGEIGSLVTHNVKTFINIPLRIKYDKDLTVVGESVIYKKDFDKINATLSESEQYANCRNLASGSLSLLDSKECAKRHMRFILFDVIKGMDEINSLYRRFKIASNLGFDVVYHYKVNNLGQKEFTDVISKIHEYADNNGIPCDGSVIRYDDYNYGISLGRTNHHYRYGIAKKEKDDLVETVFRGVEWNTSRNGIVVPTGLFDEIEILDSKVSRATLHNLNYINNLKLKVGDKICVSKRNMIIPAIEVNLDYSEKDYQIPIITTCPSCGELLLIIEKENNKILYCPNEYCPAKQLAKFTHFVSKPCFNIDGLSEKILERLIDRGYVSTFADLFHLEKYKNNIMTMDGFGRKSYENLHNAIENARCIKLNNYITSLGIPLIGKSAGKTISAYFHGDYNKFIEAINNHFDFTKLEDFGKNMSDSLIEAFNNPDPLWEGLANEVSFVIEEEKVHTSSDGINFFNEKTVCVTGAFNTMKRSDIEAIIVAQGGKLTGSVSKKTDYLLTNDIGSGSTKALKAIELGVPTMSEAEFLSKIN